MMILRHQTLWGRRNRVVWVIASLFYRCDMWVVHAPPFATRRPRLTRLLMLIMYALALERCKKKNETDHTR